MKYRYVRAVSRVGAHVSRTAAVRVAAVYIATCILLVGAFLAGCAATPVRLSSEFHSTAAEKVPLKPSDNCLLLISSIQDERSIKQSLGSVGGRLVYMEDISGWLAARLRLLEDHGYRCEFGANAQDFPDALRMTVTLRVASVRSCSTSNTASVVLTIRYFRGDRFTGRRTYRGSSTGVNWFSSESEINAQVTEAFMQILRDVSNDVAAYCAEK